MTTEARYRLRLVVIESPFGKRVDGSPCTKKELEENIEYARRCLADCVHRGEAGFGSHLLYPQCLDDATPEERKLGMESGFAWGRYADLVGVYEDRGVTPGMKDGIEYYRSLQIPIERRRIGP